MRTFIKRNIRELAWIAGNTLFAAFNLWASMWSSIWLLGAVFYTVHVALAGYWVWCIFDNAYVDELEADIERMTADLKATEDPYLAEEVRRTLNGEEAQ